MDEMKGDKGKKMGNRIKYKKKTSLKNLRKSSKGITLIALVIKILLFYDEKLKCSNNKVFLLATI